jgi:hypothetical protein
MPVVSLQPAVKGAIANAFEGEQDRNRDHFTGIETGLRMLRVALSSCSMQSPASGIWSSTRQNKSMIKSSVVMRTRSFGLVDFWSSVPHDFFN